MILKAVKNLEKLITTKSLLLILLVILLQIEFLQGYSKCYSLHVTLLNDDIPNKKISYLILQAEVYKDKSNSISIDSIRNYPFELLKQNGIKNPSNFDDQQSTYWVRFRIKNSSELKNWYVEFPDHRIDYLQAYILHPKRLLEYSTGDRKPISSKFIRHKNFIFSLPSHELSYDVYFKIQADRPIGIQFRIKNDIELVEYATFEYLSLGIFYGFIVFVFLLNFFIYLRTWDGAYLIYCGYATAFLLFSSTQDGLFLQYISEDYSKNYNYYNSLFFTLTIIFQYLYAYSFLKINRNNSWLAKVIFLLIAVRLIVLGVFFCFYKEVLHIPLIDLAFATFTLLIGIIRFRQGYEPARLFVVAIFLFLIGFLIHNLAYLGILPSSFFTAYSIQVGILFEFIFLTLGFADRFHFESKEKIKAQKIIIEKTKENELLQKNLILELEEKQNIANRINIELEQLISDRTFKLQHANEKLIQQSALINDMNLKLDKEYYKVNKELSETKKEKIFGLASEEEFENIIKSESECLLMLADLKWGEGFTCTKCGQGEFTITSKPLHRKCSNCYYIDSPTSNTILHKLKFPIYAAFKIIFLVINDRKVTIDELSTQLGLRPATVSSFKIKIKEQVTHLKKQNKYSLKNLFLMKSD